MSPHTERLLHILWWPHRDSVNTEQLYASSDPTEELEQPFTGWQQPPQRGTVVMFLWSTSPSPQLSPSFCTLWGGAAASVVCICVLTLPHLSDSHPSPLTSPFPVSLPLSSAVSLTFTGSWHGPWDCDEEDQDLLPLLTERVVHCRVSVSQGTEEGARGLKGVRKGMWRKDLDLKRWGAIWPSNPAPGHTHRGNQIWKRHVHPDVQCSTVYNYQEMEAT